MSSKIELDFINHASPNLGVSLLDQKLKSFLLREIILIDTMATHQGNSKIVLRNVIQFYPVT